MKTIFLGTILTFSLAPVSLAQPTVSYRTPEAVQMAYDSMLYQCGSYSGDLVKDKDFRDEVIDCANEKMMDEGYSSIEISTAESMFLFSLPPDL
jgi:hypothetical protein